MGVGALLPLAATSLRGERPHFRTPLLCHQHKPLQKASLRSFSGWGLHPSVCWQITTFASWTPPLLSHYRQNPLLKLWFILQLPEFIMPNKLATFSGANILFSQQKELLITQCLQQKPGGVCWWLSLILLSPLLGTSHQASISFRSCHGCLLCQVCFRPTYHPLSLYLPS